MTARAGVLVAATAALILASASLVAADCKDHAPPGRGAVHRPCPVARSLWADILAGTEISAGFRWDQECECGAPTICESRKEHVAQPLRTVDPFYVGVGTRLQLAPQLKLGLAWERDWTEAPRWQARAALHFTPWRK